MKRWQIALLITSAIFAVGIAVWRYTAPERHVSDLYRRYEHADGIAASYIHNYPVNDTITLDVTLLESTTDSGWAILVRDFEMDELSPMLQMLIDMGEVGYGHPMMDLGHAYSAMVTLVGDYQKIIGMPRELGQALWSRAIDYYLEGQPTDVVKLRKAQIEVVSCIRNFSWLALSDSFPEEVVNECRRLFAERIASRQGYIFDVCKTFSNWTLE